MSDKKDLVPVDLGVESEKEKKPASPMADEVATMAPEDVLDSVLDKPQDFFRPWEAVCLPSMGQFYDGRIPDGAIEIRPMGLSDEKIMATQRLVQSGQALDELFRRCVRFPDPEFDPLDLIAGDRIFVLYYLRGITYGQEYEFSFTCSNEDCGCQDVYEYNLGELYGTVKKPTPGDREPFKVVLPYLSKVTGTEFWVKLRLLRGRDMLNMAQKEKVMKKIRGPKKKRFTSDRHVSIDDTLEKNLNMLIVEAMGSTDRMKIERLVAGMHSMDTATIREFLNEKTPGIDTTIFITCSECQSDLKVDLPITDTFFRPKARSSARE